MNAVLITNDLFLAKGMKSLIIGLKWFKIEEAVQHFVDTSLKRYVIFIDERTAGWDFFYLLPRIRFNDHIVRLQSRNGVLRGRVTSKQSAMKLNLNIEKFTEELVEIFNLAFINADSIILPTFLSDKEVAVLCFTLSGMSVIDVAQEMRLSVKSVYGYRRSISKKWGFKKFCHFYINFTQGLLTQQNIMLQ